MSIKYVTNCYKLIFFLFSLPVLEIAGKGDMLGHMENSRARVKLQAHKYQKNGQVYMKFERIQMKIQIGKNYIELKNLFNGKRVFKFAYLSTY